MDLPEVEDIRSFEDMSGKGTCHLSSQFYPPEHRIKRRRDMKDPNVKGWKLLPKAWEVARIPPVILETSINKDILPKPQCPVCDELSGRIRIQKLMADMYLYQIAHLLLESVGNVVREMGFWEEFSENIEI